MRVPLALLVLFRVLPVAAQAPNPSFTLSNRGNVPIHEIYATPAGVDRWGRDRLGASLILPGQAFPVRLPANGPCLYDIRVVYADGRPEEQRRVDTCQIEAMAFPGGRTTAGTQSGNEPQAAAGRPATADPSFRLVNRGRAEVNELYVSETGNDHWGKDRLGDDTVARGATKVIRMPPGTCTYDLRVVFANGEATERRQLNLCTITDVRVP